MERREYNLSFPYFNLFKRKIALSKIVNMLGRNTNTLFNSIYFSSPTLSRASVIEFKRSDTICNVGCCGSLLWPYETCKVKVLQRPSVSKIWTKNLILLPPNLCCLIFVSEGKKLNLQHVPEPKHIFFPFFAKRTFKVLHYYSLEIACSSL